MKKSELRKLIREQIENDFLSTVYMTQLDSVINGLEGGTTDKEYLRSLKRTVEKIKKEKEKKDKIKKQKEKEAQLEPKISTSTIPYVPGISAPLKKSTYASRMKADMEKRKKKLRKPPSKLKQRKVSRFKKFKK